MIVVIKLCILDENSIDGLLKLILQKQTSKMIVFDTNTKERFLVKRYNF